MESEASKATRKGVLETSEVEGKAGDEATTRTKASAHRLHQKTTIRRYQLDAMVVAARTEVASLHRQRHQNNAQPFPNHPSPTSPPPSQARYTHRYTQCAAAHSSPPSSASAPLPPRRRLGAHGHSLACSGYSLLREPSPCAPSALSALSVRCGRRARCAATTSTRSDPSHEHARCHCHWAWRRRRKPRGAVRARLGGI